MSGTTAATQAALGRPKPMAERATCGSFHGEANISGLDQDRDLDALGEAEGFDEFAGDGGVIVCCGWTDA
jgi:hypothetical protein